MQVHSKKGTQANLAESGPIAPKQVDQAYWMESDPIPLDCVYIDWTCGPILFKQANSGLNRAEQIMLMWCTGYLLRHLVQVVQYLQ